MNEWILMVKDGEEKLVHPGNVDNHERFGWKYVQSPATEPEEEVPAEEPVEPIESIEPAAEPSEESIPEESAEPIAEEIPAEEPVEPKADEIFVTRPARRKVKK